MQRRAAAEFSSRQAIRFQKDEELRLTRRAKTSQSLAPTCAQLKDTLRAVDGRGSVCRSCAGVTYFPVFPVGTRKTRRRGLQLPCAGSPCEVHEDIARGIRRRRDAGGDGIGNDQKRTRRGRQDAPNADSRFPLPASVN